MINLNLNQASSIFVKSILILTIVYLGTIILNIPVVSIIVGFVLLVLIITFLGLIVFEQINDKYRIRKWKQDEDMLLLTNEGKYECGRCGNRNTSKYDKYCSSCGMIYKNK
jgi:hypothetical protein